MKTVICNANVNRFWKLLYCYIVTLGIDDMDQFPCHLLREIGEHVKHGPVLLFLWVCIEYLCQTSHPIGLFSVGTSSKRSDFRSDCGFFGRIMIKPTDCCLSISTSTLFCLSVFLHLILLIFPVHFRGFYFCPYRTFGKISIHTQGVTLGYGDIAPFGAFAIKTSKSRC